MARTGPKSKPASVHQLQGTTRKDREIEQLVETIHDDLVRPKWLKGTGKKLWISKLEIYEKRNQNVSGCGDMLAQYCSMEATLIDKFWKKDIIPPVSLLNSLRMMAGEFYDTPGTQHSRVKPAAKLGNPFGANKPK